MGKSKFFSCVKGMLAFHKHLRNPPKIPDLGDVALIPKNANL